MSTSNLTYNEQIEREINQSRKMRDAGRLIYYTQALKFWATVSYETFVKSWAYDGWYRQNAAQIISLREENNRRFGHLGQWK